MQKNISIALIAVLAFALVASVGMHTFNEVDAKKPEKKVKCGMVKIQVRVSGVETNQTVVANAILGDKVVSKTGVVEENETSIAIPLNFKKVCANVGDVAQGDVNGTAYTVTINSLKKPNKVDVAL